MKTAQHILKHITHSSCNPQLLSRKHDIIPKIEITLFKAFGMISVELGATVWFSQRTSQPILKRPQIYSLAIDTGKLSEMVQEFLHSIG